MTTRWERTLDAFANKHASDSSDDVEGQDILFIVSPASGGGNAMAIYPTCLEELKATGRAVEVYITKNSEDVIGLSKSKDLRPYKTIVVLSGDSTLYELLQEPLRQNNGTWPYQAALLLLPGGSSNVIVLEDFGPKACVKQIIRQTLSLWKTEACIKRAPIIQVSSENAAQTCYTLHVCMAGLTLNLIDYGERRRKDVYAILGKVGLILSILAYIPLMDNEQDDPTLLNVFNSDTEPGANFGFGNSRFDDTMTVIYVPKKSNPGKKEILVNVIKKLMSGELSKEWKEGKLPDYITVQKTNKYVYEAPTPGRYLKFYSDGTSQLPFECQDDSICFESIPKALPFWTVPNKEELQASREHWDIETVCLLSSCSSVAKAYNMLQSPLSYPQCSILQQASIQLLEGSQEPLHRGNRYQDALGTQATVLETTIRETDQECTFHLSLSSSYGWCQREVRVCIAKKKDGTLGRVQEKCTKGSWLAVTDANIRSTHRTLLANLNDEE